MQENGLARRIETEVKAQKIRANLGRSCVLLSVLFLLSAAAAWALGGGRWQELPAWIPALFWVLIPAAVMLTWLVIRRLIPSPSGRADIALGIERELGLRSGSVLGALEVADKGQLGQRAASTINERIGNQSILMPVRRSRLKKLISLGAVSSVLAILSLLLTAIKSPDGFAAISRPVDAWRGLLLPPMSFLSLPSEVPRGMPLSFTLHLPGRAKVAIHSRSEGSAWRIDTLNIASGDDLLDFALGEALAPVTILVDDGRSPVLEGRVDISDRGWIGNIGVEAVFPSYLGRPAEYLDIHEVIRVPRATELRVSASTYAGAHALRLTTGPDTLVFSEDNSGVFSLRTTVSSDVELEWIADASPGSDGNTIPVELPPAINIIAVADQVPEVRILTPASDSLVSSAGVVWVGISANDDHGLASVALRIKHMDLNGKDQKTLTYPIFSDTSPMWEGEIELDIARLEVSAGDVIELEAISYDASPWKQYSSSNKVSLRIPSAEEQRVLARNLADSLVSKAEAIVTAEKALAQGTENASRSRSLESIPSSSSGTSGSKEQSSASHESAEKMRSIAKQQRDLGDKVDELAKGTDELERRLDDAGAMDAELQKRFNELRKLLEDAMTPEMADRLGELEKSADRLDGQQMKQSLEELAEQQRNLQKKLEESAEMLKRAALEGAMETMRAEAEELAKAERELENRMDADEQASAEQSKEANALENRAEKLSKDMQSLSERLRKEGAETGAQKTESAQSDVEQSRQSMQELSESMSGGSESKKDSQSSKAGQAAEAMEKAASQMSEARESQIQEWKENISDQLDKAINETAQLARKQSELADKLGKDGFPQGLQGEQADVQQGTSKAAERLEDAARGSSLISQRTRREMAEAQQKVQQAGREMGASATVPGARESLERSMRDAAQALSNTMASLVRDRDRVSNSESASGFEEMMEKMQELAKQQGTLNGQMQGLSLLQGGEGGDQAKQQKRALAKQQREVAEGLHDIADHDMSGRMDAVAQEAQELARMLDRGAPQIAVNQRQQDLYRRMLDAGQFMEKEERDEESPREANAGDGKGRGAVKGNSSGRSVNRYSAPSWNELREMSPEERRLVADYFRRLNSGKP